MGLEECHVKMELYEFSFIERDLVFYLLPLACKHGININISFYSGSGQASARATTLATSMSSYYPTLVESRGIYEIFYRRIPKVETFF